MEALVTATFAEKELQRLGKKAKVYRDGWAITGERMTSAELARVTADKDILIVELDEVGEEVFANCNNLKVVGCCRGNPVNVDIEAANKFNIPVINTPGRNATAVAEITIALMINIARNIGESYINLKQGIWNIDDEIPFTYYKGIELSEKTVGLIGFGAIGREMARRLKPFDMKVLVYDPYVSDQKIEKYGVTRVDLDELLQKSRFVSLHTSVTKQTKGMIGKNEFSKMRNDAFFINTSRAVIADKTALLEALRNKTIAGAALDVYHEEPLPSDDPLIKMDNVFITPHIGGATLEMKKHHARIVLDGIFKLLDGQKPNNLFNPSVME